MLKRIGVNLWRIVNTTRKIIINLIFLSIIALFFVALTNDDNEIIIPKKTALVLNIKGDIVEQKKEIDPIDAFLAEAFNEKEDKPEVLLADIIKVIEHAKNDDRVTVLVLQLQNLNQAGLTKLNDIAQSLTDFKNSGKMIIALGQGYTQAQYYLASYADEIWLDPKGWLMLDGYGRYKLYYKSAIDKLAISQHVFKVGTYKSAIEPYTRDDMSEAAKEANKAWLTDLWGQYKQDVANQRGFSIDNFDEDINSLLQKFKTANGNFAEYALNNDWVDALKTHDEMQTGLIDLVGQNAKNESYNKVAFKDYLATISSPFPIIDSSSDQIAIIVAKGVILDGNQAAGNIGGDSTAKLLRRARENEQIKAVVLRVDSPGGSAYASEVIRREVDLLKAAGKPVVASMGSYAASGGYWISASADKIYASPNTITGSIGIFGMFMTFEKSLSQLGIYSDGVGTTDLSDFNLARPLSKGMSEIFQLSIERGYRDFISLVAENRSMTLVQVDAIAQGRVWSGVKAKSLGLVDELGNLDDAIAAAAKLSNLEHYKAKLIEKEISAKDKLLRNLFNNATVWFGDDISIAKDPLSHLLDNLTAELAHFKQFNDPQGMYILCNYCEVH